MDKSATLRFANGEELPLTGRNIFDIGRSDSDVGINPYIDLNSFGGKAGGVSKFHAIIIRHDDGFLIQDLGSTNKTSLNGEILAKNIAYKIENGDSMLIGRVPVEILISERL